MKSISLPIEVELSRAIPRDPHRQSFPRLKPLPELSSAELIARLNSPTGWTIPESRRRETGRASFPMLSLTTGLCSFCYFWNEMGLLKAFVTFAILVLHEAGHLVAARMVGLPVSAPVFLGPVGAVIGLLKAPRDAAEAAWIGIGGPLAGIAATLVVHGIAWVSDSKLLFSCAVWGYLIHLFNMVPAGTLDGGHVAGFTARWLLVPGALVIAAIPFLLGPLPLAATITVVLLSLSALWRAAKLLLEYGGFVTPAGLVDKPREKWILSILGILVVLVAAVGAWLAMRDCARL